MGQVHNPDYCIITVYADNHSSHIIIWFDVIKK